MTNSVLTHLLLLEVLTHGNLLFSRLTPLQDMTPLDLLNLLRNG
jgi:hypothetical protein